MRFTGSVWLAIAVVALVSGCGGQKKIVPDTEYNSAIEVRIGIADSTDAPETAVVAKCLVPVPRQGGKGRVLASCDGMVVEMVWDKAESLRGMGTKEGVLFTDFGWRIRNRLVRGGSISTLGWSKHKTAGFTVESKPLVSSIELRSDSWGAGGPFQVIRARWLPEMTVSDIKVEMKEGKPDSQ